MFVDSSKDILFLVIAFCVLWVTIFLCWMFYYVARILRSTNEIIDEFRVRLQALADAIDYIRKKVEQMSSALTLASGGVSGLVKKVASSKAKDLFKQATGDMNVVAKAAVNKAVKATAKKMKTASKKAKTKKRPTRKKK